MSRRVRITVLRSARFTFGVLSCRSSALHHVKAVWRIMLGSGPNGVG